MHKDAALYFHKALQRLKGLPTLNLSQDTVCKLLPDWEETAK